MIAPPCRPVASTFVGTLALAAFGAGGTAATAGGIAHNLSTTPAKSAAPGTFIFPDAPPARVTGGFGEDSCFACHWDGQENDGVGGLQISGFPGEYEAGAEYDLEVTLRHPEMAVAGFQLAIRRAHDGTQAGALHLLQEHDGRAAILVDRGVQFAHHTGAGTEVEEEGEARWPLRWTAPDEGEGTARLHVSALAGDGDESQMGDAVYTLGLESRPRGSRQAGPKRSSRFIVR